MKNNNEVTVLATVVSTEVLSEIHEIANDLWTQNRLWREAELNIKCFYENVYSWKIEKEYKRLLAEYVAMHNGSYLEGDVFSRCGIALYSKMIRRRWKLIFEYEYNGCAYKAQWVCETVHGTLSIGDSFCVTFNKSFPNVLINADEAGPLEIISFRMQKRIKNAYRRMTAWKRKS